MTELMKRYEDEQDRIAVVEHSTGKVYLPDYIAWLEAKVNISDEAIEAFQEIIRNQCDKISELKAQLIWRQVSEKPKEGQIVFAMIPTGWVVAQYLNGEFYVDDGFTFGDRISGVNNWLPIPPVPEGE